MGSWWLMWMIFMLIFLVPSLSYGWGYRGWGPPYPRYVQRRRGEQALLGGGYSDFNHQAWGVSGDLIWLVVLVGIVWSATAFWWW